MRQSAQSRRVQGRTICCRGSVATPVKWLMVRNINERHNGYQILLVDAHRQQRWHAGLAAFVSNCDSSKGVEQFNRQTS